MTISLLADILSTAAATPGLLDNPSEQHIKRSVTSTGRDFKKLIITLACDGEIAFAPRISIVSANGMISLCGNIFIKWFLSSEQTIKAAF